MTLKTRLHGVLRRSGYDIVRFDGRRFPERRRAELIDRLGVDLIIDVGANTGQYIEELRTNGFEGRIVAFEPLRRPFEVLAESARRDPQLSVHQCAVGAQEREAVIHVSANSYSSSLLPMDEAHLRVAPDSVYLGDEVVQVRSLDSFGLVARSDIALLKIDTQGYERDVLAGARATLRRVSAVEIELSYVTLYEGQALAYEVHEILSESGFQLACFGRPLYDPATTALLQIDGIFLRT